MKHHHPFAPYLAVIASVIFWGLSFVATKIALESIPPVMLLFIRFSGASCFFLGLMWYRGFPSFTRKEYAHLFFAALFQPGAYFICETTGLQYTSASKASLIIATIPIVVLGLSILFLKEHLTWLLIIGMGLSLGGVALLIVGDAQFQWTLGGSMLGDLLIFGAVLAMAIYTVTMKNITKNRSALHVTGLLMCYGALFFALPFFRSIPQVQWTDISARSLIALACLTLFATIGAFLCFNYALARLSASKTSVFLNCVPVVTTFAAWGMLGERLTPVQIAGGALVLFSVYLTNFAGAKPVAPAPRQVLPEPQLVQSEIQQS